MWPLQPTPKCFSVDVLFINLAYFLKYNYSKHFRATHAGWR